MADRTALDYLIGEHYGIDCKIIDMNDGTLFCVPQHGQHRIAAQHIMNRQYYEPKTHTFVRALMSDLGGNMVHAGAFFGDMIPTFSRATEGVVYAFEPVLENYIAAKLCVEMNTLGNVVLLNAALGQRTGVTYINTGETERAHSGGASSVSEKGQATSLLAIDALDLHDVRLIQLDVEGFELKALRGAARTLERDAPIVMIEDNLKNCTPFLQSLDYYHAFDIPGLAVWGRRDHEEILRKLGYELDS